jgi:hypothetical protein
MTRSAACERAFARILTTTAMNRVSEVGGLGSGDERAAPTGL